MNKKDSDGPSDANWTPEIDAAWAEALAAWDAALADNGAATVPDASDMLAVRGGPDAPHTFVDRPAPHPDAPQAYRLLEVGDVIQDGDELLCDDCKTWERLPRGAVRTIGERLFLGCKWNPGFFVPFRRPIDAAMQAKEGGK